ncbi:MAG TPA: hypothetical protein VFU11_05250 [Solirubrobacterales bacterium]|nr:hypothetical protein [Solirubrobacterales bacterium]
MAEALRQICRLGQVAHHDSTPGWLAPFRRWLVIHRAGQPHDPPAVRGNWIGTKRRSEHSVERLASLAGDLGGQQPIGVRAAGSRRHHGMGRMGEGAKASKPTRVVDIDPGDGDPVD